jgi:threonine aldolase
MNQWIDLRSDTVTQPVPAMRDAMANAVVGDDVYGEDPTVNKLEAEAATLLGKDAGLFVASGTASNLIALLTHCGRGDEYIAGGTAHTYWYEAGGAASLGGIQPQTLPFEADGTLDLGAVAGLIKPDDVHFANTRLLCFENTQAGSAASASYFGDARALADKHGLAVHLDGARLFNACIATGADAADYGRHCDSVSICLSKGLGAPVGSVLVGDRDFIARARRWRKMVGGGMRQAGVIAAAGLYALRHHIGRLADDHANAALIAEAAGDRYPGKVRHRTNMVFVDLPADELRELTELFASQQIRIRGPRWVTHLDVSRESAERIAGVLRSG